MSVYDDEKEKLSELEQGSTGSSSSGFTRRYSAGRSSTGSSNNTQASDGGATTPTDGGGFFNEKGDTSASSTSATPSQLSAAEKDGWSGGGLFNSAAGAGSKKFAFKRLVRGNVRRRALIGGGATFTLGSLIAFFIFAQGPGQLVHLSKILQKPNFGSEKSTANRTNGLFRYMRSGGDIGETRVGYLGSRVFKKTIDQLADVGVEFQRNPRTGNPKSLTVDSDKLSKKFPELKTMSMAERRAFIANQMGIPADKLTRIGTGAGVNGDKFAYNTRDIGIKATRALANNSLVLLEDGKTVHAIKFRALERFFNVPSLFHPFKRALANQENKSATKADRKARERERLRAQQPEPSSKFAAARDNMRGKIRGNQGKLSGALLLTAGMCIIRDVADDVPVVNRGAIAVPSAIGSVDSIAGGSQVQANEDIALSQAGDKVESFTDENGKTIWQGKALQLLADPNKPASGEDINAGYQQGFIAATTANNIKKSVGGGTIGGLVCSPIGQVVQVAGSVALLASGPFTGGASWGAFAAKTSAGVAATTAFIHLLQTQFSNLLTSDKVVPELFSGPEGGNLLAYGAREASNIAARSSGGIALSGSETARLEQEQLALEENEFRSKNLLTRVFDKNDYRSLSSSVARSVSPDVPENINKVASSATNIGSVFSAIFSSVLPKAKAAEQYNWGFPSYGIPESILNDPRFEDPYDNAGKVADLLNSSGGQTYIDKAKRCFGVNISKGSEGWQAVAEADVNPAEQEYLDANCDDLSDDNWKRTILFVFDSRTMDAIACYEDDEQSCSNTGFGSAATAASPSTSPTTDIDLAELYKDSSNIDCSQGTKDLGVHTGYAEGQQYKLRLCALDMASSSEDSTPGNMHYVEGADGKAMVNARVSQNFANLIKDAKAAGIPMAANSSFRSMAHQQALCAGNTGCSSGNYETVARPGYSNHQSGNAIDFRMADPARYPLDRDYCVTRNGVCEAPGDKVWEWLNKNASKYGLKQYVNEYWHFSPNGK